MGKNKSNQPLETLIINTIYNELGFEQKRRFVFTDSLSRDLIYPSGFYNVGFNRKDEEIHIDALNHPFRNLIAACGYDIFYFNSMYSKRTSFEHELKREEFLMFLFEMIFNEYRILRDVDKIIEDCEVSLEISNDISFFSKINSLDAIIAEDFLEFYNFIENNPILSYLYSKAKDVYLKYAKYGKFLYGFEINEKELESILRRLIPQEFGLNKIGGVRYLYCDSYYKKEQTTRFYFVIFEGNQESYYISDNLWVISINKNFIRQKIEKLDALLTLFLLEGKTFKRIPDIFGLEKDYLKNLKFADLKKSIYYNEYAAQNWWRLSILEQMYPLDGLSDNLVDFILYMNLLYEDHANKLKDSKYAHNIMKKISSRLTTDNETIYE